MPSVGINARTGQILRGYDHVLQSVEELFLTRIGERPLRRWIYAGLIEVLGRNITPRRIALFLTLIRLALDTYEPRLQVVLVRAVGNTVDAVRLGALRFEVLAHYRPNALQGDFRVEGGLRSILVFGQGTRIAVDDNGLVKGVAA